jgi:hypothetical protein
MLIPNMDADYYWFHIDQASYEAEQQRLDEERTKQWNSHMARFTKEPKLTKKELEERIEWRLQRVKKIKELGMPDVIVEHEQFKLNECVEKLAKNEYIRTEVDRIYRKNYDTHAEKFKFNGEVQVPEHVQNSIREMLIAKNNKES